MGTSRNCPGKGGAKVEAGQRGQFALDCYAGSGYEGSGKTHFHPNRHIVDGHRRVVPEPVTDQRAAAETASRRPEGVRDRVVRPAPAPIATEDGTGIEIVQGGADSDGEEAGGDEPPASGRRSP